MNITFKNSFNIENKEKKVDSTLTCRIPFAHPELPFNYEYEERPLKFSSQNLSFKGLKVSDAVKTFRDEIGESAAKHLEETITRLVSAKNSGVTLENGELIFKKDSTAERLYRAIGDPVVHFPLDFSNSVLNLLKRTPGFKKSRFIDNLLENNALKNRRAYLENYSNAMALQHYIEMLGDPKLKGKILKEAQKRLNPELSNYSTKVDRTFTRIVTGLIPAFFLANDAYNLSIYINNNKDLAKKEKERRFFQEVSRIAITAASTFALFGIFAKKGNSDPKAATFLVAALTFASEIVGRIFAGTPFYPIGKKGAVAYAKLQQKDNPELKKDSIESINSEQNKDNATVVDQTQENSSNSATKKKKKSTSDYALKLLGAMVLLGFAVEKANNIKPVRKLLAALNSKFNEIFIKDFTISKKEFDELILKLRENGFNKIADNYVKTVEKIIKDGNLTAKESFKVSSEINKRIEQHMPDKLIMDSKKLIEAKKQANDKVKREDVIRELNFAPKNNEIINICGVNNKVKDVIIKQILGFPVKLVWQILMMPYRAVVKPAIDLSVQGFNKVFKNKKIELPKDCKAKSENEILKNSIEFLRKNAKSPDFKNKLNKTILDSFDNVNKSNFSNAELSGAAKVAVSTATSAFLVIDNYNMVMIDTQGEDKKLAGQKAKERTIQRIIRIAYGACLINLFNGIFSKQYNASLLGAAGVNTINTFVIETLERLSIGLPLHEATREEIIEKDNSNLEAKGAKGFYYRLMSKLTGKKSISKVNKNKKE